MSFLTREAERLEAENWLFQHQIPALNLPTHSIIGTVVAAALTSSGNDLQGFSPSLNLMRDNPPEHLTEVSPAETLARAIIIGWSNSTPTRTVED